MPEGSSPVPERVWRDRVGERVVVRYRLPAGGATDVVGPLLEVGGTGAGAVLRVRGRRGEVAVRLADVVAGKVVPPPPSRPAPPHLALGIAELQEAMLRHWLPPDTERLGDWVLRAAGGFTGRANSVLAVGDPGMPLPEALGAVRRWYAVRGLPAMASVPGPEPAGPGGATPGAAAARTDPAAGARAALRDGGWRVRDGASAFVFTAATAPLTSGPDLPAGLALDLADRPDEAWLATYHYRGQALPPHAVDVLTGAPRVAFASVRDGGSTVAVARGSLAAAWLGVTAVDVVPAYRRRGLARVLLTALAGWGRDGGAASTFLQVSVGNVPAQALYRSAGFTLHHRYDYLVAPDG